MKSTFKDFYGCTASISGDEPAKLVVRTSHGKLVKRSTHKNFRSARQAMNRLSDGWTQLT